VKVWLFGEDEPAEWTAVGSSKSISTPGFVGLYSHDNRQSLFAWFGAAFDGASVPTPSDPLAPSTQAGS
jgi:hypothetical protein